MAFNIGSVTAKIDADITGFKKGMQEVENTLSHTVQSAEKGSKYFMAALSGVAASATALASKATLVAARTETLGVAMEAVAKATGTSTDVLKAQETALKKQGITTQEARSTLTKFMQSQLDVADASNIARVAQDLAVISGENSSETTARLTDAIATMNPMLLRQVGIVKNSEEIFNEYGKTIGKSGNELTEIEKKQAMVNLILQEGEKVTGTYEAAMDTAGKKMGSLKRYIEEANNTVGNYFLPIFGEAIDAVTEFLKQITPENIEAFIEKIKSMPGPITILAGAIMGALVPALIAMASGFWATFAPLLPFIAAGAILGFIIHTLIERFGGLDQIMEKIRPVIDKLVEVFNYHVKPVLEDIWQEITQELIPALKDLWNTIEPVIIPVLKFLAAIIAGVVIVAIIAIINIIKLWVKITADTIQFLNTAISTIIKIFSTMWDKIKSAFEAGYQNIKKSAEMIKDALIRPFTAAKEKIGEVVDWIKDKLDFTQRHSPSVLDIVNRGVGLVNKALTGINYDLNLTPKLAGSIITNQSVGPSINQVKVDLAGAVIADEFGAERIGEIIGDSIIGKLKTQVRF
jgi:phage-related protein